MEPDDGLDEEGPFPPWLPPDDRLWRHPSEVASALRQTRSVVAERVWRLWPAALIAGLVGALLASGIGAVAGEFAGSTTVVKSVTNQMIPDTVATTVTPPPDWASIYDNLAPSVVAVVANGDDGETTASGVVWKDQGNTAYILTDEDSITGATSVGVQVSGNGQSFRARVVGTDEQTGVAVIAVKNAGEARAPLGTVMGLRAGEQVATVAAEGALPSGAGPIASGVVSGTDRELQVSDGPTLLGMISIATTGSPDGGAAVVDPDGAVVGITTSVTPANGSGSGTTFAIPIDMAEAVAGHLIGGLPVAHPWVGVVEAGDLPSSTAGQLRVPGGATIDDLMASSPIANAGLGKGDVITRFNGAQVTSAASLMLMTEACKIGHKVTLTYIHNSTPRQTRVAVNAQPQDVVP